MTRQTPQWLQNPTYAAAQDRMLIGALWPAPRSAGLAVTATIGMVLNVDPGQVAIPSPNNTGTVLCTSDATEQVTIGAAPASGSNRIDLVVATARGNDLDGGSNDDWILQAIAGTVAATPTPPPVPASSVALAQVYVGGGVASIVAGNITDLRPGNLSIPALSATPRGIYASGASVAAPAAGAALSLNAVGGGAASWLNTATGVITVPIAGLYLIQLHVYYVSPTVQAVGFSVRNSAGGDYSPIMKTGGMVSAGNPDNNLHGTWLRQCGAGTTFRVYNSANPISAGSAQVRNLSVIRLGDSLATT